MKCRTLIFLAVMLYINTLTLQAQNSAVNNGDKSTTKITMDINNNGFIVIAHRGARAYYPENTMVAFRAAVDLKSDMLELDVQLSKDNVPVVFHDTKLNKRSDGKGLVGDYTLSQLQELDTGSWFDKKFKGEKIPTLEQVLEYAKGKISVNIEIKTEAVKDDTLYKAENSVEKQVVTLVNALDMKGSVMVSSFDYRAVKRVKELDPEIYTALLYEKKQSKGLNPKELIDLYQANAFNCSGREINKKWLEILKSNNIPFFVYTINKASQMKKVIEAGAKGIFSDKPDLLKQVSDEMFPPKTE